MTVCAAQRGPVFGRLAEREVVLNPVGKIVAGQLVALPGRVDGVRLDAWIVMPDHVHAVLILEHLDRHLGAIVGAFKAGSARETRDLRTRGSRLWQRAYYDHLVRDDDDLARVREYIETNPMRTTRPA